MKDYFRRSIPDTDHSISDIEKYWGKKLNYASMGRYGIMHILDGIKDKYKDNLQVMMPVYACESISWSITKAGFTPVYYDIDISDMNGDLKSIKEVQKKTNSKILLVASLYGNPGNMEEIQEFCYHNDIFMIDDAAQAFGSEIKGKPVGTFGDAGLFSFSAGKPTMGHMGCYYWTNAELCRNKPTKHRLYHGLNYLDYFYNRYADYNSKKLYRCKVFHYLMIVLYKLTDSKHDISTELETRILPQIAIKNIHDWRDYRKQYVDKARDILENCKVMSIIETVHSEVVTNNNKIVLLAETESVAEQFKLRFNELDCYCAKGYKLLNDDMNLFPNAHKAYKRIIEVPIVDESERMDHVIWAFRECIMELYDKGRS